MKIDSHQHFWNYDPVRDAWITDDMNVIQRDFLPHDLRPILAASGIDGCVAVQADQSEFETNFLLQLAGDNDWIKGVVGWVDLRAHDLDERLAHFSAEKKLKGFRHIVQAEPQDDFLLRADFCRGISILSKYSFTYDILVFHKQLPAALEFAKKFPYQPFVIDHLAKPDIKSGSLEGWKEYISAFKPLENVSCKLSGMVTEADWHHWKQDDFKRYMDAIVESFGTKRIMYGSDWPVCLLAASYPQVVEIAQRYFESFSADEQANFWGNNAEKFYNLK